MRRRPFLPRLLFLLTLAGALGGCGSKISEANYYRVQYGMTEKAIEDLLGPAHAESPGSLATTGPATTQPVARKVKSWTRGGLTIRVEFAGGQVVGRTAVGIAAEAQPAAASQSVEN